MNLRTVLNRHLPRDHCIHRVALSDLNANGGLDAAEDWLADRPGDYYSKIDMISATYPDRIWERVFYFSDADVAFEFRLAFG